MATILKFRSREWANEPRNLASPPGEVIIFPRMSLKDLCRIAEATQAGRDRLNVPPTEVSRASD